MVAGLPGKKENNFLSIKCQEKKMLDLKEQEKIRNEALEFFKKAGIILTDEEKANKIQVVDYIGNFYVMGLVMVPFVNVERYCGKFILFFPGQSCAEHWHPDIKGKSGKEETFRVLWGKAFAYGPGEPTKVIKAKIPTGREEYYTCRHEVILNPGDQYTVGLNEKHWWQAGPEGVIALEVSSKSRDEYDLTTDSRLVTSIY